MEFTVPQFIEYEAKVIGPFTFKQFIIVGVAGVICFVFYLKLPFWAFFILSIIIGGGALALVFLKFGGRSPLIILKNFFFYTLSPKVYVWKRKVIAPRVIKKEEKKEIIKKEVTPTKIVKKSRLKNLATKVETKKG